MRRLFAGVGTRFRLGLGPRFSTFVQLASALRAIEQEPSSLAKRQLLQNYLSALQRPELSLVDRLLKYAFNPFASISSKTLENLLLSEALLSKESLQSLSD